MKNALLQQGADEIESSSHILSAPKQTDWFAQIHRLHPDLILLPIGWGNECKGPMLHGWQKHPGFTADQIRATHGVRSVGIRTGIRPLPIVSFDFDGQTVLRFGAEHGLRPHDTDAWLICRDNDSFRLKANFSPTAQQLQALPAGEFSSKRITRPKEGDRKGEALEIFLHSGRQVVVLGEHPSSGGNYYWPEGQGPEQLGPPPDAWWDLAVAEAHRTLQNSKTASKPTGTRNRTRRLDPCPICGRHSGKGGSQLWCEQTDRGLILCMPGSTFSAEQRHGPLQIGQVIDGWAMVKRSAHPSGCHVLCFKQHEEVI